MENGASNTRYMSLALRLAQRARGATSPNPAVGAVIVRRGRIVGTGYHRRAGGHHAEVEALRRAGTKARGATLYVTLEPCNRTGRTPPCCDAVLRAGVSDVVAATRDPNPLTNGRGFARLRQAGVRVRTGLLGRAARQLNAPFEKVMRTGLPLVIGKVGQSLDGKIATAAGQSRWITSRAARRDAHRQRAHVDAILIGINTALADDPRLSVRGIAHRQDRPVKVIVDSRLRAHPRLRCLRGAHAIIATTVRKPGQARALAQAGAEVWVVPGRAGRVSLTALCRRLAARGLQSVLIEGGGEVLASAVHERLLDRVVWYIEPVLLGGRAAPGALGGAGVAQLAKAARLRDVTVRRLGTTVCLTGRVAYPR